ncbi:MAG: von Willebrand factor type A domain-containing protein [Lachnospiraceae bacterium]|nr:von Willebrand factor type A domain-containing protein [Lachnospiraceae bacterium]
MKKITAIILAAVMVLTLTACGKSKEASYDVTNYSNYNAKPDATLVYEAKTVASDELIMEEPMAMPEFNTEEYNEIVENSFVKVSTMPLSTFAADVDTGSYTNFRRMVLGDNYQLGQIPSGAVRIEEMVNYFDYSVNNKSQGAFSVQYETAACPWNPEHGLLMMTVEANKKEVDNKGNNFVYLVDTSGSMRSANKIDLVKESFKLLTESLNENDTVSIVTYASNARVVLEGAGGNNQKKIIKAIESLEVGGGTNGSGGIEGAYKCALEHFIEGGNNRVIIASDGDMNLGVTSQSGLVDLIKEKKDQGVFLTTLGFGAGNYSDANMERIADAGNGNYYYIDCIGEERRVLVEKLKETTVTVAKDVKFQVEFNPTKVSEYRLLGYENRTMAADDFNDDKKDGGEVGAGQQVTVLYELVYADGENSSSGLKYQGDRELTTAADPEEILTLSVRYKQPDGDVSALEEYPVEMTYDAPSDDLMFAAAVVEAALVINNSEYKGTASLEHAKESAKESAGKNDYRTEFCTILNRLN